jgi:hypothetical protein
MSYTLEAVISSAALLTTATRDLTTARLVQLRQGLVMLPMTDELFDEVRNPAAGPEPRVFWKLPAGFDRTLQAWSAAGPVAYVEAEYFGGAGEQRAAAWAESRLVLGPITEHSDQPISNGSPVSQALRLLGAARGSYLDEFEAVGLNVRRDTDDWLS